MEKTCEKQCMYKIVWLLGKGVKWVISWQKITFSVDHTDAYVCLSLAEIVISFCVKFVAIKLEYPVLRITQLRSLNTCFSFYFLLLSVVNM